MSSSLFLTPEEAAQVTPVDEDTFFATPPRPMRSAADVMRGGAYPEGMLPEGTKVVTEEDLQPSAYDMYVPQAVKDSVDKYNQRGILGKTFLGAADLLS